MVKVKHSKQETAAENESQSMHKSCYCCRAMPSHPKKDCPARDAECCKCRKNGNFNVAEGQRRKKKDRKNQGCEKSAEISKRSWAEGMSNSRNMDTAAVCSTLQPISIERNSGYNVSPSVDSASKQSQQTGGQQVCLFTMDVHTAQWSGSQVWLWGWLQSRMQHHVPVHLYITA